MIKEIERKGVPGLLMTPLLVAGIAAAGALVARSADFPVSPVGIIAGIVIFLASLLGFGGLLIVNPNEAKVLILFGRYAGSITRDSFRVVNPVAVEKKGSAAGRTKLAGASRRRTFGPAAFAPAPRSSTAIAARTADGAAQGVHKFLRFAPLFVVQLAVGVAVELRDCLIDGEGGNERDEPIQNQFRLHRTRECSWMQRLPLHSREIEARQHAVQ